MREIKFRGMDKSGCWHVGWLAETNDGTLYIAENDEGWTDDGFHNDDFSGWYKVLERTIGQNSGICDKNGNEIYEGDIIVFYELKSYCINPDCDYHLLGYGERIHKEIKVVRFEDGIFGVDDEYENIHSLAYLGEWPYDDKYMEELKKDSYFDTNGYDLNSIVGIEIIGNIHDNPELLRGE